LSISAARVGACARGDPDLGQECDRRLDDGGRYRQGKAVALGLEERQAQPRQPERLGGLVDRRRVRETDRDRALRRAHDLRRYAEHRIMPNRHINLPRCWFPTTTTFYGDSTRLLSLAKADSAALYYRRRSSSLLRQVSVGESRFADASDPAGSWNLGIVPQKWACNRLPPPSSILSRPVPGELRCHPPPTSSTRAPEVTPN